MNLLAIDTSTEQASIALIKDGKFYTKTEVVERQHAKVLLILIETLFEEANSNLDCLNGIVYGRGPGSFTGLRIACSVAKGLAYAKELPLYPVSSLLAIAEEFYFEHPSLAKIPILSVIDARMQQLYWAYLNSKTIEIEERVSDVTDIKSFDEAFNLVGVGFETYLDAIQQEQKKIKDSFVAYPSATAMIRLVLAGKIKACTAAEALPLYVRNQIVQGVNRE